MAEKRNACRLLVREAEGRRPLARNIKTDTVDVGWGGVLWTGIVWMSIGTGGELV
jgi:hypothetical protein